MTEPTALEVRQLRVTYPPRRRGTGRVVAVDDVSLRLQPGDSLGLVGESGCGKSTIARVIVGEVVPESGSVLVGEAPVGVKRNRAARRHVQMVFQDPTSSLNPRLRVGDVLDELLRVHGMASRKEREARYRQLLAEVGLPAEVLAVRPGVLSGGQRQRVSIARALAVGPDILVADEITSALDVSIQAQVLELLLRLRQDLGLSMLFISHNLAVVRQVCDRVAVMYLGRIVEEGTTEQIFADPRHPYTQLLLASVPRLHGAPVSLPLAAAEPMGSLSASSGCRFRARCPIAARRCETDDPQLHSEAGSHQVACHYPAAATDSPPTERTS